MIKQGQISLYDNRGIIIATSRYDGTYKRKQIIEKWKLLYGRNYFNCYLQIEPVADENMVETDGTNRTPRSTYLTRKENKNRKKTYYEKFYE